MIKSQRSTFLKHIGVYQCSLVVLFIFTICALIPFAQAKVDTPKGKKPNDYKVLYSDRKASQVNKTFSTKTISPQVLDRVMAHDQNKRFSAGIAERPEAIEVQIVKFGDKLEYASEPVSMKVIQSSEPIIEKTSKVVDKVVVEKVITVREEDKIDITTIKKFTKVQKREAKKKE